MPNYAEIEHAVTLDTIWQRFREISKTQNLFPFEVSKAITFLLLVFVVELNAQTTSKSSPPVAPVKEVTDRYHGTTITDSYRYMENLSDPAVQAWLKAQNEYARAELTKISGRDLMLKRTMELSHELGPGEVRNVRRRPNDIYIYTKRLPNESAAKLYLRQGRVGPERLLLDPQRIKVSSANVAKGANQIAAYSTSGDLKYLAVAIVPGGSEVDAEIHVIEIASGRETGDVVARATGVPSWLPDNRSFVCSHLRKLPAGTPAEEVYRKVRSYLHVLGSDPEKDSPVFGHDVFPSIQVDPDDNAYVRVLPGASYAVGIITTGVTPASELYLAPADQIGSPTIKWRKVAAFSDEVSNIAVHGDDLYALSFKDAPHYKIIRTDARMPDLGAGQVVLPPGKAVLLNQWGTARDALYVGMLDGGVGRILRLPFEAEAGAETVDSPDSQTFFADSDPRVDGILAFAGSWTRSDSIVTFDPSAKRFADTKLRLIGKDDTPADIEAEEVRIPGYDGTLVPLSIIHPKNIKLDGSNPTLLTGYGSYGIPAEIVFDRTMLAWYEKGGVYSVCHVRGGGEFGEEWHLAGKESTKPNTWRDFIACAEYLIKKGYTSSAHLAGQGESAGGITIGRAITERPDLFAAAVINVGILDMLRFETTANGAGNVAEFGSTNTQSGFDALYAMSAYHHVRDNIAYPAVLLTTGINDSRVDPWQTAKMAARLQAASSSGKPILLRIDYSGGHFGSTADERAREQADTWSFLLRQLSAQR